MKKGIQICVDSKWELSMFGINAGKKERKTIRRKSESAKMYIEQKY